MRPAELPLDNAETCFISNIFVRVILSFYYAYLSPVADSIPFLIFYQYFQLVHGTASHSPVKTVALEKKNNWYRMVIILAEAKRLIYRHSVIRSRQFPSFRVVTLRSHVLGKKRTS